MKPNGKLIVFEGADEVGKTTFAAMLSEALRSKGVTCELISFPGRKMGTLGWHINKLHHDFADFEIARINPTSLQLLHVAAHIDAIEDKILPALQKNRIVILDRYWWSTWVYGIANSANKSALKAAIRAELIHWKGIQPSRLFLITRRSPLRKQGDIEKWNRISRIYKKVVSQEKRKHPVTVIPNDSSVEDGFALVKEHSGLFSSSSK